MNDGPSEVNSPSAAKATETPPATAEATFADGPLEFGTRSAVDRAFAAAGLQRRVTLEVNDTRTLVDFVRRGLAVAFLPTSFVLDPQGITFVPVRHHMPVFATYIAEPTNRRPSRGRRAPDAGQAARGHLRATRWRRRRGRNHSRS